ncbi:MAG: hypothetical protein QHH01_07465 [Spirochaetales bacterium]|nr:hypothetical protein [Spirochaetales bacterium]
MKFLKIVAVALAAMLLFSCSTKLAQSDLDAANAVFAEAQNAKADVYAADEYKAAEDAKAAVDAELAAQEAKSSGKDYKKANELIKAYADAAKKAKETAAANAEKVKAEVEQLKNDVNAVYTSVQVLVDAASKDAKKAAKAKLNVKYLASKAEAAGKAIADAQAAFDGQDYITARDSLNTVKADLDSMKSELEAAGFTAQ